MPKSKEVLNYGDIPKGQELSWRGSHRPNLSYVNVTCHLTQCHLIYVDVIKDLGEKWEGRGNSSRIKGSEETRQLAAMAHAWLEPEFLK